MRRLFLVALCSFLCAVCFADQPWEDISTYAPSFGECKIRLLEDESLLFNVTAGSDKYGFAIADVDELLFLGLINGDFPLNKKQEFVEFFLWDVIICQEGCYDCLTMDENGNKVMKRATSKKLASFPSKLREDMASFSQRKSKPQTRDWEIPSQEQFNDDLYCAASGSASYTDDLSGTGDVVDPLGGSVLEELVANGYVSEDVTDSAGAADASSGAGSGWWVIIVVALIALFAKGSSPKSEEEKVKREYEAKLSEARAKDRRKARQEAAEEADRRRRRQRAWEASSRTRPEDNPGTYEYMNKYD